MNGKNSIEQIEAAFLDVRKAYRLLYTYQQRVMDIIKFIGQLTSRQYNGGWSKFSNSSPKDGKGNLDMWAWDWLNMYCYEFFFGDAIINGNKIGLSVWLVSDTGFYDTEAREALNLDSFSAVENATTKFVIFAGKNAWYKESDDFWNNFKKDAPEYIEKNDDGILLAKSFSLSSFINEAASRKCLHQFAAFCAANSIPEITILN